MQWLGDSLAKWYEFRAIASALPKCSFNAAAHANGKLCYELITDYGRQAIIDNQHGTSSEALEYVMDAIFLFAGLTSIMGVGNHVGAAHALFEGFTRVDKTRAFGHGLLVGFGNLVLLALEGRSDAEIGAAMSLARQCGIPTAIGDIAELTEQELNQIASVAVDTDDMRNMPQAVSAQDLLSAIRYVSALASSLKGGSLI